MTALIPATSGDDLVESRDARDRHAGRTEVLDKVKALRMLPDGVHVTTELVANYYEVEIEAVKKLVQRNQEELTSNGYLVLDGQALRDMKSLSGITSRTASLAVFTRRAVLNVGMLLRDSVVAKQVRTYLLDTEQSLPHDYLSALKALVASEENKARQARELAATKAHLAELEPAASFAEDLSGREGSISVNQGAKLLSNSSEISIGERGLWQLMSEWGWTYRREGRWAAKQDKAIKTGRLCYKIYDPHWDANLGKLVDREPQVRITWKGLREIHAKLGGLGPLMFSLPSTDA